MSAPILGLGLDSPLFSTAPQLGPPAPASARIRTIVEGALSDSPPRSPRSESSSNSSSPSMAPNREGTESPSALAPEGAALRSPAQQALDRMEKSAVEEDNQILLTHVREMREETDDANPDKLRLKAEKIVNDATQQPYPSFYVRLQWATNRAKRIFREQGKQPEIAELNEAEALANPNRRRLSHEQLVDLVEKLLLLGCMLPDGEIPPLSPQSRPVTPPTAPSSKAPESPHHMALITLNDAVDSSFIDDLAYQRSQFDAKMQLRFIAATIVCVAAAILGIVLHKGFVLAAYLAYEVAKIAHNALHAKVFSRMELRKGTFFLFLIAGRIMQSKFEFKARVNHPVVNENEERWNDFILNYQKKLFTLPPGNYHFAPYEFQIGDSPDAQKALHEQVAPLINAINAAHEELHVATSQDRQTKLITVKIYTCQYRENAKTAESLPPSLSLESQEEPVNSVLEPTPPNPNQSMALVPVHQGMTMVPAQNMDPVPVTSGIATQRKMVQPSPPLFDPRAHPQPTNAEQAHEAELIEKERERVASTPPDLEFEEV